MSEIILVGLVVFLSAFVQGFSGFAFSLILIPLLGLFFNFHDIVILNIIFSFILNLSVFIKIRKYAKIKELAVLIVFAIIFTVVGARFIGIIDEKVLKLILGVLLVVSSVINLLQIKITIKEYKKYYPYVGGITGFLNGISGISGPPLIIFFSNIKMDKLTYKATFNTIFLSLNVVAIVSYALFGYIEVSLVKTSMFYGLFVVLGAYAGLGLSHKVKEHHFKLVVTYVILVMGFSMIVGEL